MVVNTLKDRLRSRELVVGSFVYLPSPGLTEIVGLTGFDFVVIDMEHGSVGIETAEEMVRAAEVAGVVPMIRVTANSPHLILRALDCGAAGVHIPDICDRKGAESAVASSKYGPQGSRGLAGVRAAAYGLKESLPEYTLKSNLQTLVVAHIEDFRAIERLDELLGVEGIDVYYIGPVDLSNSLGIPGQTANPRVKELVEQAIHRITSANKMAGCLATDLTTAKRYLDLGVRYVATHAVRLMVSASRQFLEELRQ